MPIAGIGVSVTAGSTLAALEASLRRLVASGCTHAELSTPQLCITLAGQDNAPRVEALGELCARYPLGYTLHAPIAVNFMEEEHNPQHRAVLQSAISFAARIGASLVVIHPGRTDPDTEQSDRQRLLRLERDEIRRAADLAGRHAVRLGMENLNPNRQMMAGKSTSYALDPSRLAEQIAAIGHPAVTGVLDFGHGWLAATRLGFDFLEAVAAFAPHVGHLHVTDNCGLPMTYFDANSDEHIAYGMGDLHLPIGWGSVPYNEVLPLLQVQPGTIAMLELAHRHDEELERTISVVRKLVQQIDDSSQI